MIFNICFITMSKRNNIFCVAKNIISCGVCKKEIFFALVGLYPSHNQSMWRTWSKHCHFEHQDFRIEVYTSRLPFFGLFESIWRTSSVVNFSKNMNYFFSQPAYLVFISWVKRISVVNQLARQTDFERAALDKTTKMIIHYSLQRLQFHMKRGAKVVYVGIA